MTVAEIVEAHLKANKLDGLVSADNQCGCKLPDIAPCVTDGMAPLDCRAGVLVPCKGVAECWCKTNAGWHIKAVEEEQSMQKLQQLEAEREC